MPETVEEGRRIAGGWTPNSRRVNSGQPTGDVRRGQGMWGRKGPESTFPQRVPSRDTRGPVESESVRGCGGYDSGVSGQ